MHLSSSLRDMSLEMVNLLIPTVVSLNAVETDEGVGQMLAD